MDYREEMKELREKLNRNAYLYYVMDAPTMSDYEYDMLNRRLVQLEREHPEFIGDEYPGGFAICPVDAGYERITECPWANKEEPWETVSHAACYECWNRPIK